MSVFLKTRWLGRKSFGVEGLDNVCRIARAAPAFVKRVCRALQTRLTYLTMVGAQHLTILQLKTWSEKLFRSACTVCKFPLMPWLSKRDTGTKVVMYVCLIICYTTQPGLAPAISPRLHPACRKKQWRNICLLERLAKPCSRNQQLHHERNLECRSMKKVPKASLRYDSRMYIL